MWRLRPLIFLALSQPRLAFGTVSAARTDWESMTAAVGVMFRPAAVRAAARKRSWMLLQGAVVAPGGEVPVDRSPGREVFGQVPPGASGAVQRTGSRSRWPAGNGPAGGPGPLRAAGGSSGSRTAHSSSSRSEGYRRPGRRSRVGWPRAGPAFFLIVTHQGSWGPRSACPGTATPQTRHNRADRRIIKHSLSDWLFGQALVRGISVTH